MILIFVAIATGFNGTFASFCFHPRFLGAQTLSQMVWISRNSRPKNLAQTISRIIKDAVKFLVRILKKTGFWFPLGLIKLMMTPVNEKPLLTSRQTIERKEASSIVSLTQAKFKINSIDGSNKGFKNY